MPPEDFNADSNPIAVAVVAGAATCLLLLAALAAYTYKYGGGSRTQGFRNWSFNVWRKCVTSKCVCVCCPDDDDLNGGPRFRESVVPGEEQLTTISEVVKAEDTQLRSAIARILGIANFETSTMNLDRSNLRFTSELGKGWFGFVVRGTLNNLTNTFEPTYNFEELRAPVDVASKRESDVVVVQQLREEAKVSERNLFFQESRAAAIMGSTPAAERHPNVLCMVGCCLDKPPLMLIYEYCSLGDLKTFLRSNRDKKRKLEEDNVLLRFCRDVTSGLSHLHRIDCIPNDLAARTCQIDHFFNVKIGDYGVARSLYPGDYLSCDLSTTLGFTSALTSFPHRASFLPLRWMAPEALAELQQSRSPVDSLWIRTSPKESIWMLGLTLWEICSFGETPFAKIFDHQFFLVMTNGSFAEDERAGRGQMPGPTYIQGDSAEAIHDVIDLCLKWDPDQRTNCQRVENYFRDLYSASQNQDRHSVQENVT